VHGAAAADSGASGSDLSGAASGRGTSWERWRDLASGLVRLGFSKPEAERRIRRAVEDLTRHGHPLDDGTILTRALSSRLSLSPRSGAPRGR
jgi:hypothetical protein